MVTNAEAPKKGRRKFILIGAGALTGLCILCLAIGLITSNSPTYKATQTAKTAIAGVVQSTQAAMPTNTTAPTNPPEPTKTKAPTNTPAPTNTAEPTTTTTPAPQPVELNGTGDQIVDVDLPFEGGIVHLVYNSARNFIVTSYDKDNQTIDLLVNTIGAYDGFRPVDFYTGQRTTRLEIKASGPWTITFYPLSQEYMHICSIPGTCKGKGDDVILLEGGTPDLAKFKYTGERNFIVTGHGGSFLDVLANEIGAYEGTVMIGKGVVILDIQSSGEWEVEITTK